MTTLSELLATKLTQIGTWKVKDHTPQIHCMDGTTLSIQTGSNLYCAPREDVGPWYKVEIGFPSRHFPQLDEYFDGTVGIDDPTGGVYGYVPIELAEECIAECGGICIELTLLKHNHKE